MTHDKLEDITMRSGQDSGGEPRRVLQLTKAALPHMRPGSSIIGTSSVNSDSPTPTLLPYDVTKAGIANSVAPGPVWTPLIPSTMPAEHVESFGDSSALGRPGNPPRSRRCT